MSKKLSKMKSIPVYHLSAEEATKLKMPRYNAYAIGHGVHGDVKYNRLKSKKDLLRHIYEELG